MAKALPYFKWYPADADSDEKYSAMNDTELGFFHRCLNKAWKNDASLPSDPAELARAMKVTPAYFEKVWRRVGVCFRSSHDSAERIINPRQYAEFLEATKKSERATDAVRTRYERSTDALPRAVTRADCVSDSSLNLILNLEKQKKTREPGAVSQSFAAFWARWCELTRRKQRESFACQAWISVVEFETEAAAMACLERYGVSDEVGRGVVGNPDKWIYDQARDQFNGDWPNSRPPDDGEVHY